MLRSKPRAVHEDERGRFVELWRGESWQEVNYLEIKKGATRGNHYHKRNFEYMIVVRGSCWLTIENVKTHHEDRVHLKEGDCFVVEPFDKHAITAEEDCALISLNTVMYDPSQPDMFVD